MYNSDILKLANWYTILKDVLDFENLSKPEEADKDVTKKAAKATPKKAVAKPAPKAQSKAKVVLKKQATLRLDSTF